MTDKRKERKVPSGRIARLAKLGGLASAVAGNIVKGATKQMLSGQRPSLTESLRNIDNAISITKRLAHMRGAAMKLGQLLSMDAGELLPIEWEPILSRLRQEADPMPKAQLLKTLAASWSKDWHQQFSYFSFTPIASASIGQVHRATLKDGRQLAIKVQYPGVRESIDSDIDNVMNLLKLSGVLPKHIDLTSVLAEAKAQLKAEANYLQEAEFLNTYRENLGNDPRFIVPFVVDELTDKNILTMEYIEGSPITDISNMSAGIVDLVCSQLMDLTYQELFTHKLMQSDPNFANFLYQSDTQKIVLLDFGACRQLSQHTSVHYLAMADAMQRQDNNDMRSALYSLGLVDNNMSDTAIDIVLKTCFEASYCLQSNTGYNLKKQQLIKRIREVSMPLITDKTAIASPIFEVALVNRKITGMILLANKLGATLDFKSTLAPYLLESAKQLNDET
ncbi:MULTISPECIES: AarF/ABC1/UbiB kinase family protein [unclassified Colwellia]|jgi:predicted unusual protein kinase regulating ubiquinone biosynthesis (AarF/ABC1/UbiB family)|uniref:ABC1 kinase family protein n=1 Tax=unclassified Colwellia TaxID=196834 RepID=UPI0015F6525B|nr:MULTISPECIES: AarF/ABC1/UbiB kinase family protein [unclassified Colwellia]MBA6365214.1 AarF/ABC1/UbiB kinase family protein [Colwellia sp. BRX8-8]MBA6351380.1 AarF/ABC1/UbiB kinase family protein [Colwellia sp. BRX9-1]MBA6354614.1 AarF/ABC1/UbiB kinase family protein [Colwellia sp. BRX8-3]MBA6358973.1 AarF/ABC1/UbiB kinase family protein [Colwellia sp. BRX8-6]MBA6366599.1 AarF/ABC1/UbiB kinase family protein [Colwellia sp. BRX8-5]